MMKWARSGLVQISVSSEKRPLIFRLRRELNVRLCVRLSSRRSHADVRTLSRTDLANSELRTAPALTTSPPRYLAISPSHYITLPSLPSLPNIDNILNLAYSRLPTGLKIRLKLMRLKILLPSLLVENQMITGLPTTWSSGTKPQTRESSELWRLSPIIQ